MTRVALILGCITHKPFHLQRLQLTVLPIYILGQLENLSRPNPAVASGRQVQRRDNAIAGTGARSARWIEVHMVSRRGIPVAAGNIRNAENVLRTGSRALLQIQLHAPCAVVHRCASECRVGICNAGIPEQLAGGGTGLSAVPGIVGDGIQLISGSEFEDFATGLLVVVICQMRCGV